MNRISKVCFVVAAMSLIIMAAVYFMIAVWIPVLYFFLAAAVGCIGVALALDWKLYFEFLTLRTTKHGMNMGVLILLVFAGLVCINYLGVRYNKTFDLTVDKQYSLSDQSRKLINGLANEVEIKVFYKGPNAIAEKGQIQRNLDLYHDFSNKLKIRYLNSYVDQAAAQDYLVQLQDRDSAKVFAFAEYGGKRIRIEAPFDENQITGAIVKASRRGDKKVYFLKGHGERDLESDGQDGLKSFKEALESQAFKVESLNLLESNEIPKDADFIAIVGPKTALLEPELSKLRDYAKGGGRFFVAGDPGQHHNLGNFVKSYGVEFMNNYLISLSRGGYTPMAVAVVFSNQSKITQDFQMGKDNSYAVFDIASELRVADLPNGIKADQIVKTSPYSLTMNDLSQSVTEKDLPKAKPYTVAIEVKGRLDTDAVGKTTETNLKDDAAKQFEMVVFGDSDFVANQSLFLGINRDLALNAAADLAHETDLIGSRPKSYKGTIIDMGRYQQMGVIMGGIGLPIFLLLASGVMWFRRRGA